MELVFAAATVVAAFALWVAARSAVTVCVLRVASGKVELTRGSIAPKVLADIADVVGRPPVSHARLRVVRSGGNRAELQIKGSVPVAQRQRLMNVVGQVPLAKLINGRRRRP